MGENNRFELRSYNFHTLEVTVHDTVLDNDLHLTIYKLIDLLNKYSRLEYELYNEIAEFKGDLNVIQYKLDNFNIRLTQEDFE